MPVDDFELGSGGEPEFLTSKPVRESIRVKRSPDAAAIGRGTLSTAGKVVVILYEDLANYKVKTEAIAGPGDYFAEYCVDGRTQRTWAFHVEARASTAPAPLADHSTAPVSSDTDARLARIERALIARSGERPRNRARRLDRAFRHSAAAQQQIDPLEFARVVKETAAQSIEQERQRQEQMRAEMREMREELNARMSKENPTSAPRADPNDTINSALKIVDTLAAASERLNPTGEGGGVIHGIARLIDSLGVKEAVKPLSQLVVGSMMASAAQQQRQGHPQPPAQTGTDNAPSPSALPPTSPVEKTIEQDLTETMATVVYDLKRGKRPGHAADLIEELLQRRPELQATFDQLLEQEDAATLRQLSAAAGEDLSGYTGALNFITDLKDELSPADDAPEAAGEFTSVEPSHNGNGAHASAEV
jgi:hypothetical protein